MSFSIYVATIHLLNYSGQESKNKVAVYVSNIPVTLKQGQDHEAYNDNVDPKQGYYHAKF